VSGAFLGLDLGTGSAKALLLSEDGAVLGEGSASYRVRSPLPGWAESSTAEWWSAAAKATQEAVGSRAGEVRALGLSGQMHGVVLSDAGGRALRPAILWADARSEAQLEAYRALGGDALRRLANPLAAGMAGPTLLWLRENEPGTYGKARWALQPKDWLRLALTGEAHSEPSDASATLLYDLPADGWAFGIAEGLGLREDLLAPLLGSDDPAGALTGRAARHLGLGEGLPVAAGAADTAAAALGTGLLRPGVAQLTVGTGAQVIAMRGEPASDASLRTHLYRAAAPRLWYAMAAVQNAGLAIGQALELLDASWADLYRGAFSVGPGAGGVTFLPYLSGERTPHFDPRIRGSWAGIGLGHGRAHLLRSVLEGVAFALKDGLLALEDAGPGIGGLRLAGGGTRDPRWRQMLADVLGRPLLAVPDSSASARGAALLAGVAAGAYRDEEDTLPLAPEPVLVAEPGPEAEHYVEAYERYKGLYPPLRSWTRTRAGV